ncbi:flagellar motor protein MotB [Legionella waltersii]|uniref:Flagellar motor protein MotD n=1 Tax=Legionella waltersii TaxID=66969 RepID=A0A0W1AAT5_9GAMM|nr:flagellar motor protein MotB [Legionella waltersii]KTD78388.1 flagellar motor protein MotD [Legionella waltersii]SNV06305.1 flagellar motor protein MotB [Legionella waltersii]
MKHKPHKTEDHEDSHRWVVSYADFITLLFAFFVVMYAISSVNDSKYKSLSEGMKSAFNQKDKNKATQSTDNKKDGPEVHKTKGTYKDGLDDLNKSLSDIEDGSYKINRQEGWVEIDIKAEALFDSGSSDIKAVALIKLMQVAGKIKELPFPVVVEGYTDNIPINTPQFPSNWELSASRAATVGRILNGFGITANRILVTGYGDQYPIADNSTESGRNQNRRVSILITKSKKVERIFNPDFNRIRAAAIVISH